jgi:hypothetical protein
VKERLALADVELFKSNVREGNKAKSTHIIVQFPLTKFCDLQLLHYRYMILLEPGIDLDNALV